MSQTWPQADDDPFSLESAGLVSCIPCGYPVIRADKWQEHLNTVDHPPAP